MTLDECRKFLEDRLMGDLTVWRTVWTVIALVATSFAGCYVALRVYH